jgi:hypothetical protein
MRPQGRITAFVKLPDSAAKHSLLILYVFICVDTALSLGILLASSLITSMVSSETGISYTTTKGGKGGYNRSKGGRG